MRTARICSPWFGSVAFISLIAVALATRPSGLLMMPSSVGGDGSASAISHVPALAPSSRMHGAHRHLTFSEVRPQRWLAGRCFRAAATAAELDARTRWFTQHRCAPHIPQVLRVLDDSGRPVVISAGKPSLWPAWFTRFCTAWRAAALLRKPAFIAGGLAVGGPGGTIVTQGRLGVRKRHARSCTKRSALRWL